LTVLSPPLLENSDSEEADEILPGSELQKAIALSLQVLNFHNQLVRSLSLSVSRHLCFHSTQAQGLGITPVEPECVICLETFSRSNPRLPTLCNCGVGRVNFHHSCLLEWIVQHGESTCPSCDTTLYYEEHELAGNEADEEKNEVPLNGHSSGPFHLV
jgi:hypothetical protein